MNRTELDDKKNAFKNALLYQKKNKISMFQQEIERELSPEEMSDFLKTAEEWKNQCFALGESSIALAKIGKDRDCLEFDDLQKKAMKLGGNANAYICQQFDNTAVEKEKSLYADASTKSTSSKRDLNTLFWNLRNFSSWGHDGEIKVQEITENILSIAPNEKNRIDIEIRLGKLAASYYTQTYKCGGQRKPESALHDLQSKMKNDGLGVSEIKKAEKQYRKGVCASQRAAEMRKLSPKNKKEKVGKLHETMNIEAPRTAKVTSDIDFGEMNPNFVSSLAPATKWTVLFDETGSNFSDSANDLGLTNKVVGKGVMLIVPEYTKLPNLPKKWHAVDQSASEIQRVINLVKNSRCGILGIPCTALGKIHRDRWFSCIETLLDLLLRLLPVDKQAEIQLLVEHRGIATSENKILLDKTCGDALHHLSRVYPERAEAIRIDSKIISKDMHPWNGYVDAAAYIWSSSSCKQLLSLSNWQDTCFLGATCTENLRYYLDYFARENTIRPDDWSNIISEVLHQHKDSILRDFLRCVGEQAKEDVVLWEQYLIHTSSYLNSKAINIPILGAKISWLLKWQPTDCALPPRLRLLWLTAKLAEENHRGCINTFPDQRKEFIALSEQLFEEDAPLTCYAALNLAVSYTDEFDFEGAKKVLDSWRTRPAEVPGLQYYGQLQSSFGQHEAFLGNNAEAIRYFKKAIETFNRLSEKNNAESNIGQTSSYLLTSLMDCLPNSADDFRQEAEKYFCGPIADIAPVLGASADDGRKYQHHIMLRYLTGSSAAAEERKAYLSSADQWLVGVGHPWEMIEFYRSLLVESPTEKLKHLQNAYCIAMAGEGTMHVIAAVILGTIFLVEPEREKEYLDLVNRCAAEIPALGNRLNILRDHVSRKYQPLELAALVLPFNFR